MGFAPRSVRFNAPLRAFSSLLTLGDILGGWFVWVSMCKRGKCILIKLEDCIKHDIEGS